jgi:hypothetical protein
MARLLVGGLVPPARSRACTTTAVAVGVRELAPQQEHQQMTTCATRRHVTTFIDPAILNDQTAAGISKPAKTLLASAATACLMPHRAAEMMEPADADLEKLNLEVQAFGLRLPTVRIVESSAETEEFDRLFNIVRTDSADAVAVGMAAAVLAAAQLCKSTENMIPAERALLCDSLYVGTEQIMGAGLERPALTEDRVEASPASISSPQRWVVGHKLFVALIQALILAHQRIGCAIAAGDSHLVSEGLRRATALFHGAAVAMRLTGAMSPPEYERIRELMAPPNARKGFSGTWMADHRRLLRVAIVCHTPSLESAEIAIAHDRYFIALNCAYVAHAWVCRPRERQAGARVAPRFCTAGSEAGRLFDSGRKPPIDRRRAHVILHGDVRNRQFASAHKRAYRTPLAVIEFAWPAAVAAAGPGRGKPSAGALSDDRTLQFCERGRDVEDERAHRRGRVDRFRERHKVDAAFAQFIDEGDKVFDGAAEAVEAPNDQRVAIAQ